MSLPFCIVGHIYSFPFIMNICKFWQIFLWFHAWVSLQTYLLIHFGSLWDLWAASSDNAIEESRSGPALHLCAKEVKLRPTSLKSMQSECCLLGVEFPVYTHGHGLRRNICRWKCLTTSTRLTAPQKNRKTTLHGCPWCRPTAFSDALLLFRWMWRKLII